MYEIREEEGILNKEDRRIVAHKIPDTLLSVEFYSKSTWIPKDLISRM